MPETQEAQQLKRRARRRLVGAIALVLFLVIVPPMVMDLEPKPVTTDLTVEIPRQETARPAAPPAPQARAVPAEKAAASDPEPRKPAAEAKTAPAEPQSAGGGEKKDAEKKAAAAPKTAPEEKKGAGTAESKVAAAAERGSQEAARAEAILKGGTAAGSESFVVPLGAYANSDNVKQLQAKLTKAGVKSFTEPVKVGAAAQTRVAAGPYASRAEAESAREKLAGLKDLGVVPGTVTTR